MRFGSFARAACVAGVVACGGGTADEMSQAEPAADARAAETRAGLIPGTPAGGLEQWIQDIYNGLEGVEALSATDGMAAQRQALEQYIDRQEYIELYYGPGGRLVSAEHVTLGAAVDSAEARFHDLMRVANEAGDSTATAAAVSALRTEYDRVLSEARAAGVPLTPDGGA